MEFSEAHERCRANAQFHRAITAGGPFSTDTAAHVRDRDDGTNQQVWTLHRETLKILGAWAQAGRWAGHLDGAHNLAADAKGNLFITETYEGKRVQNSCTTVWVPPRSR